MNKNCYSLNNKRKAVENSYYLILSIFLFCHITFSSHTRIANVFFHYNCWLFVLILLWVKQILLNLTYFLKCFQFIYIINGNESIKIKSIEYFNITTSCFFPLSLSKNNL